MSYGGCFTGESTCLVLRDNNLVYIPFVDIVPGEIVVTGDGSHPVEFTRVRFVIRFTNQNIRVSRLAPELSIHPSCPIRHRPTNGYPLPWMVPRKIVRPEPYVGDMYNLVLHTHHTIWCHGYDAVTLGHNRTENEILRHTYFGNTSVVEDLVKEHIDQGGNGETGTILVHSVREIRSASTREVIRYLFNE